MGMFALHAHYNLTNTCCIATFIDAYIGFQGLRFTFIDVIVGCLSKIYLYIMSHCVVYQGLHFTVTLSRVISHYDVKPLLQCLVGICQHNQRCDTLIIVIVGV